SGLAGPPPKGIRFPLDEREPENHSRLWVSTRNVELVVEDALRPTARVLPRQCCELRILRAQAAAFLSDVRKHVLRRLKPVAVVAFTHYHQAGVVSPL